jgi:hypothetical protein
MTKPILTLLISSFISLTAVSKEPQPKEEVSKPIPGSNMNMNAEEFEATILKVYTAKSKSGTIYNGYVVKWNGSEIVVSDMFGGVTMKVGDKIKFMVQEMNMPSFDPKDKGMKMNKIIQFIVMPDIEIEE